MLKIPALHSQTEFCKTGIVPTTSALYDENCTICTDELVDNVVNIVSCRHSFHRVCILRWLQANRPRNRKCPNCRKELYKAARRDCFAPPPSAARERRRHTSRQLLGRVSDAISAEDTGLNGLEDIDDEEGASDSDGQTSSYHKNSDDVSAISKPAHETNEEVADIGAASGDKANEQHSTTITQYDSNDEINDTNSMHQMMVDLATRRAQRAAELETFWRDYEAARLNPPVLVPSEEIRTVGGGTYEVLTSPGGTAPN